ncbi:gas vesicle protein G [Streptosporangium sp. NPDC000239]|uniref:Gas vesicle protein GvpG n=1 Tax=Streptosporangium jomthongense TaxID=1193683 RepID=A0ABV8EWC2_9ACTN
MDLFGLTLGLPFAPIRGLIRLAELIEEQVELETRSPAGVRRRLEEIAEARRAGLMTEEEETEAVTRVLGRLTGRPGTDGTALPGDGERG